MCCWEAPQCTNLYSKIYHTRSCHPPFTRPNPDHRGHDRSVHCAVPLPVSLLLLVLLTSGMGHCLVCRAEDAISLCLSTTCVCVVAYAAIFCASAGCLGLEVPSVKPRGPGADCSEVEVPYEQEVGLYAPQPFWTVQCPCQCTTPHQLPQAVRLVQLWNLRPHDRRCSTHFEFILSYGAILCI